MKKLFILKIGGSVATYKENTDHTIRKDLLTGVFAEIAALHGNDNFDLIIVHGAGGHVHHLAHTHGLKTGTLDDSVKVAGALETQKAVSRLHNEIIKIGNGAGLELASIPTHGVITQTSGKIDSCDTKRITEALSENKIPVLHGDMVDDRTLRKSICSGDAVTAYLTTLLPVTHLFFATDVDGIFTTDPHTDPTAELVENLNFIEMDNIITLTESHNIDTTGGLQGKMNECTKLFVNSKELEEIHIFNGLEETNYHYALNSESFSHTRILK